MNNHDTLSPLKEAVTQGHEEIVKMILQHQKTTNINNMNQNYLINAIEDGYFKIVKLLLEYGVDVNNQDFFGYTPLMHAVFIGHLGIVKQLLNHPNIDVFIKNDEGETALDCAENKQNGSRIVELIRAKMESKQKQKDVYIPPLKKKINAVKLVEKNINKKFLEAVSQGNINEMDSLLDENGTLLVDINTRNESGDTALMIASDHGNLDIVRWLLSYEEDLSLKDAQGNNALIRAANKGYFDVVEELLNKKANINSSNNDNRTALMNASENGYIRVVKLLIKKGSKITLKDKFDQTALDMVMAKIKKFKKRKQKKKTLLYHNLESIKTILKNKMDKQVSPSFENHKIDDNFEILKNKIDKQVSPSVKNLKMDDNLESIKTILKNKMDKQVSPSFGNFKVDDSSPKTNLIDHWEVSTDECEKDLNNWEKNDINMFNKIHQLIEEIKIDPFRGIGRVERLTGDKEGWYSRRINKKDRLVYEVDGEKVILKSCEGHYK